MIGREEAPVTQLHSPDGPTDQPAERDGDSPPKRDASAAVPAAEAHRWGFGAFLLAEAVLLLSAVFIAAMLDPGPPSGVVPVPTVLVGTIVPTVLAAGVAVLATVLRGNGPKIDLRLTIRQSDLVVGLKLGAVGVVLTVLGAFIWTKAVGAKDATSAIGSLLDSGKMSVAAAVVIFIYIWLVGPICEELIYRGLLWGAIQRQQWGRWPAFGLSTAIFAASHLEPMRTILLLVIALPIGFARLRTGRLPASVVAHQVNNFLPALVTLLVGLGVMAR
jgi:membrane protease YdiL (CAAX protease family)